MEPIVQSFVSLLSPTPLAFVVIGVVSGIIVGSIPGLVGSMLMTLVLPLTFYMDTGNAIALLVSIYVGGITGGLISAILLKIPGTPASVTTTFDGYPMVLQGKAERALALGIMASFLGFLISWVFLVTLSPLLAKVALSFSFFEYFAVIMMGLVLIASVTEGSMTKGLMSGVLGMLVAMPGMEETTGDLRLTFGNDALTGGLGFLPVLIGIFAGSQMIDEMGNIQRPSPKAASVSIRRMLHECTAIFRHIPNLLRSSVIGTWVGILPGIGANIGSILAYTAAVNVSKTPEQFGKGAEAGVVASEAANNATIGGALIPLITMGIPGSVGDAILMAALILHNVQPGPLFLSSHPDLYYGVISSSFLANCVMLIVMLFSVPLVIRLVNMPRHLLVPLVFTFCIVGAYAVNSRMFDVGVMVVFSAVGYALQRAKVPLGPFVIGLILAPIAEMSLRSALMSSAGSYLPFVTRPVALVCLLASVAMLMWPLVRHRWSRAKAASSGTE